MPTLQSLLTPRLASGLPRADAGTDRAEPSRRVLGVTRVGVFGLLVLAAANGLFLYLVPGRAELDYAWAIGPPINAAFIGGRVSRGLRGHRAGRLQGAVMALAADPAAAAWRARHHPAKAPRSSIATASSGTTPTWGWLVVYAVVPGS